MKVFHCDHCQQTVFFENSNCVNCGHALAYLADIADIATLEPIEEDGLWKSLAPESQGRTYRLCENYSARAICNWAMPAEDDHPLCVSCRLTRVLPNLELAGSDEAWRKLEAAKRRLVYSLLQLRLPLLGRAENPERGLAYDFLSDELAPDGPVLTGHEDGVITINIVEADDVEREKRRLAMHEPYRTLLGHFRHEVGHYYWDVLIQNTDKLQAFRQLFGDETVDYAEALKRHYEQGPPEGWQENYVSTYASSHPWEDWAETWAHYLHLVDTLETAAACGLAIQPQRNDEPTLSLPAIHDASERPFDAMIDDWRSLIYALNNLNRSLGLADSYPFLLPPPMIEKLRFVHHTVLSAQPGQAQVQVQVQQQSARAAL